MNKIKEVEDLGKNEDRQELLNKIIHTTGTAGYSEEQTQKIRAFLERGFPDSAMIVIGSIFTFAKKHNQSISTEEIIKQLQREWDKTWKYQTPLIRADVDMSGGRGIKNRQAIERVYEALNVPSPLLK